MNYFDNRTKSEIISRLDKLTLETKGRWGKMNITQMLAHMNDAFRISFGMKESKDRSNFLWTKILFPVTIYGLRGFPKSSTTPPEINPDKGGSQPKDFYIELEFLKKMLDIFNERGESKFKPHPLFGKLTKEQWRDLFAVHLNHHLKQFGV